MGKMSGKFASALDLTDVTNTTTEITESNLPNDYVTVTLESSSSSWNLVTSEGYLYSTAAKNLYASTTKPSSGADVTISIASSGAATITFGSYGDLQYNSSNPRFLNYTNSQTAVQLYKKVSSGTTDQCDKPTKLTPADGTVYEASDNTSYTVKATAPTSGNGTTVEYSTDQTNWASSLSFKPSDYADAGTLTVYARTAATSSLEASSAISATYTITTPLESLSALRAKIIEGNSSTASTYYVKHGTLYVTRGNGSNKYMQDADCGVLLYNCSNISVNTSYGEGLATVKGCMYNNQVEFTSFSTTGTAGTETAEPVEVSFADLYTDLTSDTRKYESRLVTVKGATVSADVDFSSATSGTITNGTNTITVYRRGSVSLSLSANDLIDITGIATPYMTSSATSVTPEIILFRASDVTQYGSLTISAKEGFGTYYDQNAFVMPEGVKGGIVTNADSEGKLTIEYNYEAGKTVPAKTALLLCADNADTYTFEYTSSSASAPTGNLLYGAADNKDSDGNTSVDGTVYYYKLAYLDDQLGFYWGAESGAAFAMTNENHAFLAVPQTAGAKGFALTGETTGIEAISISEPQTADKAVYTLSGVRVSGKQLPAGIYVSGGKKFIVK